MNKFLKTQCQNMAYSVDIFEQACILAAREDDGTISKAEANTLKRIRAAAQAFKKELNYVCNL